MPDDQFEDRPPYLSLTTLTNFRERWGDGPIPPRIDKSALDSLSGGTQAQLLSTLRQMGFINPEGSVLPALREAVRSEERFRYYLDEWARRFYAEQIALAEQNATAQMLHESFAKYGYRGSTLRKAVVFYLAVVEYLGLPNSPMFRPPKQGATPTTRRRPRSVTPAEHEVIDEYRVPTSQRGEVTIVKIGDLATITVAIEAQWMKLPVETITSMRTAIETLEGLGTTNGNVEED